MSRPVAALCLSALTLCLAACPATVEVEDGADGSAGGDSDGDGDGASSQGGGSTGEGAGLPDPGYPGSAPALDQGYYAAFEIDPGTSRSPEEVSVVPLYDGRFLIAWLEDHDEEYEGQGETFTLYWTVGARDEWLTPTRVPGVQDLTDAWFELFHQGGRLLLVTHERESSGAVTSWLFEGDLDGFAAAPVALDLATPGAVAQHPDGSLYIGGTGALQRYANGAFEDAGVPAPTSVPEGCTTTLAELAFVSSGQLIAQLSCPDQPTSALIAYDGAWSEPRLVDIHGGYLLLGPRDGASPALSAITRTYSADAGSTYTVNYVSSDATFVPLIEAYTTPLVDPWGRPFLPGGTPWHSDDRGETWFEGQTSPSVVGDLFVGAFQRETGRPVFSDGVYALWFEPTSGEPWP